jgi:hypothetical protein
MTLTLPSQSELAAMTPRDRILTLEAAISAHPEAMRAPAYGRRDFFAPGLYAREVCVPAGHCVVGKIHRHEHLCMVLGDVTVFDPVQGIRRILGCETFVTPAGVKRAVLTHAVTWWTTFHANPTDERDIAKLEAMLLAPDFDTLDRYLAAPASVQ